MPVDNCTLDKERKTRVVLDIACCSRELLAALQLVGAPQHEVTAIINLYNKYLNMHAELHQ